MSLMCAAPPCSEVIVWFSENKVMSPVVGMGKLSSIALLCRRQQHSIILTHFSGVQHKAPPDLCRHLKYMWNYWIWITLGCKQCFVSIIMLLFCKQIYFLYNCLLLLNGRFFCNSSIQFTELCICSMRILWRVIFVQEQQY